MNKFTVTVLDTTGIQPYIFGSNKLRENIGASYLVKQATEAWVQDTLEDLETRHQVEIHIPDYQQPEAKPYIEDGKLAAELIYAGGGNTVLIFKSQELAIEFTQILSRRILIEAPGINLVAAHKHNFDWDKDSLYKTVQHLMKYDLDHQKQARVSSSPLLGLGVTAACQSTQLVPVDTSQNYQDDDESSYLISREIKAKLDNRGNANQELRSKFQEILEQKNLEFPYRMDQIGRTKGESSYYAVVHADGNSMGKRFQQCGKCKSNREYITEIRKLSHSINEAGIKALTSTIKFLVNSIIEVTENGETFLTINKQFKLEKIQEKYQLPFRPLVYGGDDVTFVCDGRLGLELAVTYLQEFEKQQVADDKPIYACAGVCIVKSHYPFARAYELSESLCKNAKKLAKYTNDSKCSAIDWHISASGLLGSISEIREREYKVKNRHLTMRPLRVTKSSSEWRTWDNFSHVVKEFQIGKDWSGRQNKIKALRDVLRQEKQAVEAFLHSYRLANLPIFPSSTGYESKLSKSGWINDICGYFDAIEAMDFYLLLGE